MVKKHNGLTVCVLIVAFVYVVFFVPRTADSEFYRYVDENGKVHYVDDMSRIPHEYRDDLKSYDERFDHLPEAERKKRIEEERIREAKKQEELEIQLRIQKELEEKLRKEQSEPDTDTTAVQIAGNHVLVPVTVGYRRKTIEAMFVLDTGAEVTVIHQAIADQLKIQGAKKGFVKVAGGNKVEVGITMLSYLQAGPHRRENLNVVIISPETRLHYDGLLGMNFLRDLKYHIDFKRQLIVWTQ